MSSRINRLQDEEGDSMDVVLIWRVLRHNDRFACVSRVEMDSWRSRELSLDW